MKVEKCIHSEVCNLLRHINRTISRPSNTDIDPTRSINNYSYPLHPGESDWDYYQRILDESYIYGRGTQREKDTITALSFVITAPDDIRGDLQKEKAFYDATFNFFKNRYEWLVNFTIHRDESEANGASSHAHMVVIPREEINHNAVRHKTTPSKNEVKLPSGRYVYDVKYKLDKNKQPILLKNYDKKADLYNYSINAKSFNNASELKHVHYDLQEFLKIHKVEGTVVGTGSSLFGIDISPKVLKDFTKRTGYTLDDVKALISEDRGLLDSLVNKDLKIKDLERKLASFDHDKKLDITKPTGRFTRDDRPLSGLRF